MFQNEQPRSNRDTSWAIALLTLLSVLSLVVTVWILSDFQHEQEILRQLTQHLPVSDLPEAHELAGELQLQSRLSILLILNIVLSCIALTLLVKAYFSSQRSLRNVLVLATDVLASLDEGVVTTDSEGRILSINPRGRELVGDFPIGTEIAVYLNNLPDDYQPLREICQSVSQNGKTVRDHDFTVLQQGHIRHLRAGCSPLQDHNHRQVGTVIHIHDDTEKTLIEQRLRRMERYIGLGSLASGLQHEIKNPLSALSLHIQLLTEAIQGDIDSKAINESLEVLRTETNRITLVLENFRDFASVSKLNRNKIDLKEILQKLVKLTEPQAVNLGIEIQTDLPAESCEINVDAVRIEQVLLNLVINSFHAMPKGGKIQLRVQNLEASLQIEVADTGCGIPAYLQDKVFDPYFTTRNQGTGMGLALCDKIVRQHDGTIEFTTSSNGTTFVITLPR